MMPDDPSPVPDEISPPQMEEAQDFDLDQPEVDLNDLMNEGEGPNSTARKTESQSKDDLYADEICFLTQKQFVEDGSLLNDHFASDELMTQSQNLDSNFDRGLVDFNNSRFNLNTNFLVNNQVLKSISSSNPSKPTLKSGFS